MTQSGTVKRINEDSFQINGRIYPDTLNSREQKLHNSDDYWQLYSITDGIGGAGVGDISSRVVQSFIIDMQKRFSELDPYYFNFNQYIQNFVNHADKALQERLAKVEGEHAGCSLALILFAGDICYTMSIGNCRIYLYREGKLFRMTEDHVLHDDPEARPLLFLGKHPGIVHLKAQNLKRMQVRAEDHFLLLSDGVTGALQDEDIQWILDKPMPLQAYVESIFQNARRYDARDNQTVLGLKVESRRAFSNPYERDELYFEEKIEPQDTIQYSRQDEALKTAEYRLPQMFSQQALDSTRPIHTAEITRVQLGHTGRLNVRDFDYEEEFVQEEHEGKELFDRILAFLMKYPGITVSVILLLLLLLSLYLIF